MGKSDRTAARHLGAERRDYALQNCSARARHGAIKATTVIYRRARDKGNGKEERFRRSRDVIAVARGV